MLADVRNGYGFAACDTGDGFNPISLPKELPDDVSPEVAVQSESWGGDGHSHTWLTVAELDAYNWEQTTKLRGWVSEKEYKQFLEAGRPESWCGGISGGMIRHISNEKMNQILQENATKRVRFLNYVKRVRWSIVVRTMTLLQKFRRMVSNERIENQIRRLIHWLFDTLSAKSYFTKVEWEEPYSDSARYWLDSVMPLLRALGEPDDVRTVFWFDN